MINRKTEIEMLAKIEVWLTSFGVFNLLLFDNNDYVKCGHSVV